jgi:hypothetical protein
MDIDWTSLGIAAAIVALLIVAYECSELGDL